MSRVRVIDLDGSLAPQSDLAALRTAEWIHGPEWGLRIRIGCTFATFGSFQRWLFATPVATSPVVTLYGSGDYHHVTLALLRRIEQPFNLLLLDKHPDWMRGIPFLHAGTWLRHALRLPMLKRVFHCGGELDFDNAWRWMAPWSEIRSGRVVVFAAARRFVRGPWATIPVRTLLAEGVFAKDSFREALQPYLPDLAAYPLYVSIDKDVMDAKTAAVNWDSGLLSLQDAVFVIETFLDAARGRLVGADIVGDWSPVRLGTLLSRLLDRLDHPSPHLDPADAAKTNRTANAAILAALLPNLR